MQFTVFGKVLITAICVAILLLGFASFFQVLGNRSMADLAGQIGLGIAIFTVFVAMCRGLYVIWTE